MKNNEEFSPDQMRLHQKWLAEAEKIAQALPENGGSPHPNVKVGALLVGAEGKEIARSSNRFARGLDASKAERFDDDCRSLWINCAEQMVLANAARYKADIMGACLYITLEPCAICAGLIVEAGIGSVIVPDHASQRYDKLKEKWKQSITIGHSKLAEGGVTLTKVNMPSPF